MRVLHETKFFRRVVRNTKIDRESENIEYPGTASSFKVCKSVGVRIVKHRKEDDDKTSKRLLRDQIRHRTRRPKSE